MHLTTREHLDKLEAADKAYEEAKWQRRMALQDLADHVRSRIVWKKLDRGTICRRLGIASHQLGNFLHLQQRLADPTLKALLDTIEVPLTDEEKKRQRTQPLKRPDRKVAKFKEE